MCTCLDSTQADYGKLCGGEDENKASPAFLFTSRMPFRFTNLYELLALSVNDLRATVCQSFLIVLWQAARRIQRLFRVYLRQVCSGLRNMFVIGLWDYPCHDGFDCVDDCRNVPVAFFCVACAETREPCPPSEPRPPQSVTVWRIQGAAVAVCAVVFRMHCAVF